MTTTRPDIPLSPEARELIAIVRDIHQESSATLELHTAEEMERYGRVLGYLGRLEARVTRIDERLDTLSDDVRHLAMGARGAGGRAGAVAAALVSGVALVLAAMIQAGMGG